MVSNTFIYIKIIYVKCVSHDEIKNKNVGLLASKDFF